MNRTDIKKILEKVTDDIESVADERAKVIQKTLLNLIEALLHDNDVYAQRINVYVMKIIDLKASKVNQVLENKRNMAIKILHLKKNVGRKKEEEKIQKEASDQS